MQIYIFKKRRKQAIDYPCLHFFSCIPKQILKGKECVSHFYLELYIIQAYTVFIGFWDKFHNLVYRFLDYFAFRNSLENIHIFRLNALYSSTLSLLSHAENYR